MNKYDYWFKVWKKEKESGKTNLTYGQWLDAMFPIKG
jgi:hypothetical protein